MIKIRLINNIIDTEIAIPKIKYIVGSNIELINRIIESIEAYFSKEKDSDFALEKGYRNLIFLDDQQLNLSDHDFFYVSKKYDLVLENKLGSKSLLLKYLNSLLEGIEYSEEYQTLTIVFEDLMEKIEEKSQDKIHTVQLGFENLMNRKNLLKYFVPRVMLEELEISNFDLNSKEKIIFQLEQIKSIVQESGKRTFVLYEYDYIDQEILSILESFRDDVHFLVISKKHPAITDYRDVLVCEDEMIDLYADEKIYELCMNYKENILIDEMRNLIMESVNNPVYII